jgi:hypothetical protein
MYSMIVFTCHDIFIDIASLHFPPRIIARGNPWNQTSTSRYYGDAQVVVSI